MHALDIVRDEVHRARAEERHHGDDVGQVLGLHLHQVAGHARAFQLEDAGRLALAQEGEGLGVIQRDVVQIVSFMPWRSSISLQARCMTVRVDRPRKSTFSSPSASTIDISNWVTDLIGLSSEPLVGRCSGA